MIKVVIIIVVCRYMRKGVPTSTAIINTIYYHYYYIVPVILYHNLRIYYVIDTGELQPWAEPQGGAVIINDRGPLDEKQKPYGTFPAQTDYIDPQILTNEEKIASK